MLEKERLVKQIAKRKRMDERVVRLVADYPLKFARDRMREFDWRPVRIRYLGVFTLKHKFRNRFLKVIKEIPQSTQLLYSIQR